MTDNRHEVSFSQIVGDLNRLKDPQPEDLTPDRAPRPEVRVFVVEEIDDPRVPTERWRWVVQMKTYSATGPADGRGWTWRTVDESVVCLPYHRAIALATKRANDIRRDPAAALLSAFD